MKYILAMIIFILATGIFLFWFFTVAGPVLKVELTYQIKKTSQLAFGTPDIRTILFPNFNISIIGTTTHPDGSIVIPSLFLDEPVIYNVNPDNSTEYLEALKHGIAHAAGTKLPGYGGLGYYFAHSSSPSLVRQYNAVFYLLGKLKGGEKITLWHDSKQFDYIVTKTLITEPTDLSFLDETQYTHETVVLQTCWPPGTSSRRLLVFAEKSN